MKKTTIGCALLFIMSASLHAQDYNVLTSPAINNDGSVTFNVRAPGAKEVLLDGQFLQKPLAMQSNDKGLWSVTVKPEQPDIYPYNFIIDNVRTADPGNMLIFPNESFKASLLEMPNPDALYTIRDVAHGKVTYSTYHSRQLGQHRPLIIYTPAEYDRNPQKSYPVLYLISGTTDTEETWLKVGRANTILDNLIAEGKADPMIVVMPYGYMNHGTPMPSSMEAAEMYTQFAREMEEGIMPFVERNYRTINDSNLRAISGFSRGGGQAMFTAFKHPDKFGWLGSISAYLTPAVMTKYFPNLKQDVNSLKMMYIGVGTEDFLYNDVVRNMDFFTEQGIEYEKMTHPGSHTWMHARYVLAEIAQKIFREEKTPYKNMRIDRRSAPGFTIYEPKELSEASYPVLVFGNGACSHSSKDYEPLFESLIDNGYIVLSVADKPGAQSVRPTGMANIGKDDWLLDGVDWICRQNVNTASPYYHRIDVSHIAVGGHSCGGAQALAVSYDPRVATTIMFNSGMGDIEMAGANTKCLEELHSPILYLIGGPDDIAYENAEVDFTRISQVPVANVNFPVGHGGTYGDAKGGIVGEVALQWLDWQLKGKKDAAKFFQNASWRKANYPDCTYKSKKIK